MRNQVERPWYLQVLSALFGLLGFGGSQSVPNQETKPTEEDSAS